MLHVMATGWVATLAVIAALLIMDWLVLGRRPHAASFGEAARWSAFYIAGGAAVRGGVRFRDGMGAWVAVLRWIRGREEPFRGQPVRVLDHHQRVRRVG